MEIRSLLSVCVCVIALASLPGCGKSKDACPDCTPSSEMSMSDDDGDDAPSAESPAPTDHDNETLPEHPENHENIVK